MTAHDPHGSDPTPARSILVVDDDTALRTRLVRAFADRGLDAQGAADGPEALTRARAESPELAVVDLRLAPGPARAASTSSASSAPSAPSATGTPSAAMGGLEVVRELLAIDPATRIVVLTGYGSIATAIEAIRIGAVHYLTKPATADEILRSFDREPPRDDGRAPTPESSAEALEPSLESVPSLARVEWEHIQRVLQDSAGNVSLAARLLGIHRRSLQRKLGKMPVRR